jgi:serine/threonine-protein kinase
MNKRRNRVDRSHLGLLVLGVAAATLLLIQPVGAAPDQTANRVPTSEWPKFHYDLASTGFNPRETILSPSTVGNLALKWSFTAAGSLVSSPAVVDDVAYAATYGANLYALDAASGTRIWAAHTGDSPSDITVAHGMVFIGTGHLDYRLYAFDAATGVERWHFQDLVPVASPLVIGSTVYAANAVGDLYALRVSDGSVRWSTSFVGGIYSGMAAAYGSIFVPDGNSGCARALDQRTGAIKWTRCLGDTVESTPAVSAGKVFVSARDGNLYALDAINGAVLWTGDMGDDNFSSVATAYGMAYIGSTDGKVYAFPQNCTDPCSPTWTYQTGDDIVGASPVVANGDVYIGGMDHTIYGLDAQTGAKLWAYETNGYFSGAPAVLDGVVYLSSFDKHLYAFGLP